MKAKLIKFRNGYELYDGNEMIGSTYPYQNIPLLSLKNCQAIERGYDLDELAKDYIQSLQQTEWEVEVEYYDFEKPGKPIGRRVMKPKLDADGCLILKRV